MKKLLLVIILFLFLASPVFGAEIKGNLTGVVVSADKQMTISHIQTEINRIMALIIELTKQLNQLLKVK